MNVRSGLLVVLTLGVCTPVFTQQGNVPAGPTFRVQVDAIELDAVVTDAQGNPITDLTIDDFELFEDGQRQTIGSLSLVNIPPPQLSPSPTTRRIEPDVRSNEGAEGRVYVIGLADVAPEQALRTRRFLHRFIEHYFGANDMGAVVLVGQVGGAYQDLTDNRRLLLDAIDKFTGGIRPDPLPRSLGSQQLGGPSPSGAGNIEARFAVRRGLGGLRRITEFMATIRGRRKALLLFSEGFTSPDLNIARVLNYRGGVLTLPEEELHWALTAATRSNVTVYPIDPRGLTAEGGFGDSEGPPEIDRAGDMDSRQNVRAIAEATGGFALVNSNSFEATFDRIVRENSSYYVLGYSSTNDRRDGRFRRVELRVNRPGAVVRTRSGYTEPLRATRAAAAAVVDERLSPALAAALGSAIAVPAMPMRVFAASLKGTGKEATVPIAVEVAARDLALTEQGGTFRGSIEAAFVATDTKTSKIHRGDRVGANLTLKPETYDMATRRGLRIVSEMHLLPGRYQLRAAAGNGTGRAGSVVYDIDVPDYTKQPLMMSSIVLTTNAPLESTTLRPRDTLRGVLPGPVIAVRDFDRDDTITVFAEVYENLSGRTPAHSVDVELQLLDARPPSPSGFGEPGTPVRRVTQQRSSSELQGARGGYGVLLDVPLKDLAAGTYVIRLQAQANIKDRVSVAREIEIRVR